MISFLKSAFLPLPISSLALACFLAIMAITLSSCAHYYYAPNSTNIPLLKEKEAKLNFQYAGGTISEGFEMQSAFAVSKNFAGMANLMFTGSRIDDYIEEEEKTNTSYLELGGGYFTPVKNTVLVFETYGGIGFGGVKNEYSPWRSKVGFTKLFLQPNIGIKVKGFEFGISTRLSYLNQNVRLNTLPFTDNDFAEIEFIEANPTSVLLEPGAVLRFGGKKFMVQLQYTTSFNLSHPDHFNSQEIAYFGIGASFPITYKTLNP